MKVLIQRVSKASVTVDNKIIGQIDTGILAYIGIGHDDTQATTIKMIDKILTYRIFENEEGKLDKNVQQANGGLLLVSQFTLMAKTDKGRRPDFGGAMPPAEAELLFNELVRYAHTQYDNVAMGQFGAFMLVDAVNEGPLNFLLEC